MGCGVKVCGVWGDYDDDDDDDAAMMVSNVSSIVWY